MEYLQNGFTLSLTPDSFPLSTDSIALAGIVKMPRNSQVLDLCAGCGTLGLMLCAKDESCQVTGIELCRDDHLMALENSRRNNLEHRLTSLCADIKETASLVKPGKFHICVSNPPYFSGGITGTAGIKRQDLLCPPETLFSAAAHSLKWGGDFYIVHKPEMLARLCALGNKNNLEAKTLTLLRHRPDQPISLILLKLRKGGKPGLIIREETLYHCDGSKTDFFKSIYHIGE